MLRSPFGWSSDGQERSPSGYIGCPCESHRQEAGWKWAQRLPPFWSTDDDKRSPLVYPVLQGGELLVIEAAGGEVIQNDEIKVLQHCCCSRHSTCTELL